MSKNGKKVDQDVKAIVVKAEKKPRLVTCPHCGTEFPPPRKPITISPERAAKRLEKLMAKKEKLEKAAAKLAALQAETAKLVAIVNGSGATK